MSCTLQKNLSCAGQKQQHIKSLKTNHFPSVTVNGNKTDTNLRQKNAILTVQLQHQYISQMSAPGLACKKNQTSNHIAVILTDIVVLVPILVGICSFYLLLKRILKWWPDWLLLCTKHVTICRKRHLWQHDASFIITFVTHLTGYQQNVAHANWLCY